MRCHLSPLCPPEGEYGDDVCPEMDGPYGITHKDGMSGCRHPYNWADKRANEYADYLGKMGEEMGRMWDEHKDEIIQIRLSPSHWELAPEDTAPNCGAKMYEVEKNADINDQEKMVWRNPFRRKERRVQGD